MKFPHGRRSQDDCDILRAAYHYYQELAELGVDTIDTDGKRLIEGERYPSLRSLLAGEMSEGQLRREVLGLSQQEYASLVGVSRRTLSDMEGDRGNVSLAVMNRVYRPLGLRVGLLPRQTALLHEALEAERSSQGDA